MVSIEIACRGCPLKENCDPHLGPYKYKEKELITTPTKFECPSYTCGDGRKEARLAMKNQKLREYPVEINGKQTRIKAVSFGQSFQKFTGVIVSIPEGKIFSLSPEGGKLYYPTGQSAFR
jgi:hypothetical protein